MSTSRACVSIASRIGGGSKAYRAAARAPLALQAVISCQGMPAATVSDPRRLALARTTAQDIPRARPFSSPSPAPAAGASMKCQAAASMPMAGEESTPTWEIRMLYDGDCPLCMREVDMLKGRDAGVGRIDFVDISSPSYSPEDNAGITFIQAMEKIHGILPDGRTVTNIEVFRRCYEAVGLGWVYAITTNPTVAEWADKVYMFWAKYRLQVTGRPGMEVVLEQQRRRREGAGTASCAISEAGCGPAAPLVAAAGGPSAAAAAVFSADASKVEEVEEAEEEGVTCTLDGECSADWGEDEPVAEAEQEAEGVTCTLDGECTADWGEEAEEAEEAEEELSDSGVACDLRGECTTDWDVEGAAGASYDEDRRV